MIIKNKVFPSIIFLSIWSNLFYQIAQIKNNKQEKELDKLNKYFSF